MPEDNENILDPSSLGLLHQAASVIRSSARGATQQWACSIVVSGVLCCGEIAQTLQVVACPCRPTISNELVRFDCHLFDDVPSQNAWKALLRQELEPFILGVGQVRVHDSAEGIIVLRFDKRLSNDCH